MKKVIFSLMAIVITSMSVSAQGNSRNPHDNVGRIHNQLVEEFLRRNAGTQIPVNEICEKMQTIANANAEYRRLGESPINCGAIESGAADIKNNFRNVISNVRVSDLAKKEIQSLVDHMFSIAETNTSQAEFHRYVVAYEDRVLANRNISEQDKKVVLGASSVARHSTSMWNRTMSDTTPERRGWFSWVIIGAADVVGTVAGGGINVGTGAAASGAAYTMTNPNTK